MRIISEGLTNALRHQGPGTQVDVELALSDVARLTLISSTPSPTPSEVPGSGVGLIGVEERALALGGKLETWGDAKKFIVRAELPLQKESRV